MDAGIPLEALIRIQLQYLDMPGLKLTPAQIQRLCSLPQDICNEALQLLTRTGFLRWANEGSILSLGPQSRCA